MTTADAKAVDGASNAGAGVTRWLTRLLLRLLALGISVGFYLANRHYRLTGQSEPAMWALGGAVVFGYAALHGVFGRLRSFGLAAAAVLGALGYWKGGPTVGQGAQSAFAVMAAMQTLTHQDHPRSAQQATALRDFAQSLPAVAQFAGGDLTSPENAARAMRVIGNILAKAERLGATEMAADPKYRSAVHELTVRAGLSIGLDSIDEALQRYLGNPTIGPQAAALQARVRKLRQQLKHDPE